jgi:hypothetical protein
MAQLLQFIFINYHIPPDEVMAKPRGTRAFMFACAIEDMEKGFSRMKCPFSQ